MTSLGRQDGVPMVSALVCTVTHWIRPIVSHDVRLSESHNFTNYVVLPLNLEHIELVSKSIVALTYRYDPKAIIHSL